ncbi:MAG: hypothetical protein ACKVRP_01530 [Bacteroidota bacterium]
MDAFESVVAAILQRQGYWTLTSVKVELTKEEKREIGRHSSPRWELDVVAYRGSDNELRVVECKSFLDSGRIRGDESWLKSHFEKQDWLLFGPEYIRQELNKLRDSGYENSVAAVVTKLLLREAKSVRVKAGVDAAV